MVLLMSVTHSTEKIVSIYFSFKRFKIGLIIIFIYKSLLMFN